MFHKIVLTGGPSGGKSTLQREVENNHFDTAYSVPEVATILLSGGFPTPTEQNPWSEQWQRQLQVAIAISQIALEEVSTSRAQNESKKLIVLDRGLLDGAAYLHGGIEELEEITGQNEESMLGRYDTVLHLTTSAKHGAYDKQSNEHRFEEAEVALELDDKIMSVWQKHPNRIILDQPDKSSRILSGLQIIRDLIQDEN